MAKRRIVHRGQVHSIGEWVEIFGIHRRTFEERRKRGWTVHQALETPVNSCRRIRPTQVKPSELAGLVEALTHRVALLEEKIRELTCGDDRR